MVRRLSDVPLQPAADPESLLERKFGDLVNRLLKEDALDLEAVKVDLGEAERRHRDRRHVERWQREACQTQTLEECERGRTEHR